MGREYKEFLEKKYVILEKEFRRINKDSNDFIDMSELSDFIHSYESETGKRLPEDYCKKLFYLIDLNHDETITIQEFIFSYMLLEEKLKLKKIKLTKLLEEIENQSEKTLKERNKFTNEELTNRGVSVEANLNIVILEARELKPMDFNGKSDPYCVMTINGKQKSKTTYKPATLEPVWNEEFNFRIDTKEDVLKIEIYDKDNIGADDLEGIVKISSSELLHQQKVDDWIGLTSPNGDQEKGYLRVRVQLVWSKFSLYDDLYKKSVEQGRKVNSDIDEIDRYLEIIEKPYGIILYGEVINLAESKILEKGEEAVHYLTGSRNYLASSKIAQNESLANRLDKVFMGVFKHEIEWGLSSQILLYSLIGLSLIISMLARGDFTGLIISIYVFVIFIYQGHFESTDYLKTWLKVNLFAVIYDLVWIIFHYGGYWSGNEYEYAEIGLKMWTYFFSFLSFCVKLALLISVYMNYEKLNSNKSGGGRKSVVSGRKSFTGLGSRASIK
eukprot:CAMPEP_0170517468 /NCGR_PEP_ID=MMETSP0209-20121228/3448_1 /TAXON_ID=665100 ORGANISM="Litonotus pictus, Strain P1" /NCGR_SAMPLE_ID=MMETSP0209 /ASSEMBLY_ACC=CAM_ASM_000301 /LENGTH=498 /DNA_ID=CAMNT_0010802723 /DNA_START=134 /DNA_END=1630 /DNA_ORIENTATION=+